MYEEIVKLKIAALGKRIKAHRVERHLSVLDVADMCHFSPSMIVNVESGNPSISIVHYMTVLHYFGYGSDIDDLISTNPQNTNGHNPDLNDTMDEMDNL